MRQVFFGAIGAALVLLVSCTGDDTVAPTPKKDAGGTDATTTDADTDGPTVNTGTLCYKYGGYSKVDGYALAITRAVAADCRISPYFTGLALTDQTHLHDCLARQLGEFLQCDGVTYAGSSDSLQQPCRTMAEAHQNLDTQITTADFTAFVADVVSALKQSGVSDTDVAKIVPSFNLTSSDVVQNQVNDLSQSACDGGPTDGGTDGEGGTDASDSGSADAADSG